MHDLEHPAEIGPYRVLGLLGEGGMGVVYAAEQRRPIVRRVALKVIKVGMDTKEVLARFEGERQALALLDHPNVTKVLDAGATLEGRPYFAMELVRGVAITRYCDENRIAVRDRLVIFQQACAALQHAHERGIVHRDLKPSNLLVTEVDGAPVLKVIDFGLAKATNQRLTERTLFTEEGRIIGTPEYMSPEQAATSAQDVDARSDVFSLGVVLYELLAGALPFDFQAARAKGYFEVQRCIREEEPPTPLRRISGLRHSLDEILALRRCRLQELASSLKRGLDAITMKAIAKRRGDRYASCSEFGTDVQRFLAGEPVLARRNGVLGVLRGRWTRLRGRRLALVPALALAGCVGIAVWLASRRQADGVVHPGSPTAVNATSSAPGEAPDMTLRANALGQPVEWTLRYASGALRARGTYDGVNKVGIWTHFHENGRVEANGALDRTGKRTGEWVVYHPDGSIRARGRCRDDREDGIWTFLFPNGGMERRGQYDAGARSGPWRHYYSDGRVAAYGYMHRDARVGAWSLWTEGGARAEERFPPPLGAALVFDAWPNGLLRRIGVLEDGQPVGRWTSFHPNGNVRMCCTRIGQELSGVFEARRADGSHLAYGVLEASRPVEARVYAGDAERDADSGPWPKPNTAWSVTGGESDLRAEQIVSSWLAEIALPTEGMAESSPAARMPDLSAVQRAELEEYIRSYVDGPAPTRSSLRPEERSVRNEMARLVDDQASSDEAAVRADMQRRLAGVGSLRCADGTEFDLRRFVGQKRVLIVVLRGYMGEVCAYCHAQTAAVAKRSERLKALNIEVLVVFPGPRENADAFARNYATEFADDPPPYRVYYDDEIDVQERSMTLKKFGLEFTEQSATILLDVQGRVQHASVNKKRADRPHGQELGRLIDSLDR